MGMAASAYYSAEAVRALPDDGKRYETVHGELLVTPAPGLWHQEIVRRLLLELSGYLEQVPVGHVLQSPADISWSEDTLVQPDLFVADLEQTRTLEWSEIQRLLLVIEVLSPSTARYDRFTKRRLYQEIRIPDYWLVDSDRQLVEVWTPEATVPCIERHEVIWHPPAATRPFTVELQELFRPI